jgi:hypothetical protein
MVPPAVEWCAAALKGKRSLRAVMLRLWTLLCSCDSFTHQHYRRLPWAATSIATSRMLTATAARAMALVVSGLDSTRVIGNPANMARNTSVVFLTYAWRSASGTRDAGLMRHTGKRKRGQLAADVALCSAQLLATIFYAFRCPGLMRGQSFA